ncbi:acyltransferase family protein [Arsenicicoccus dermatophilus]|uniref:acyltransferase family protein n=1 Tax=Arsenicicoccus dermatophilus TaxID=1076331 RepID=UPI001F4D2161|nr:acyltransferase [Arsenicicoccus dermatophilus]
MIAPRPTRLPALDGMRALGALMVLTTHVAFASGDAMRGPYGGLLARLDAGVPIFFVVSGLLLTRPHARTWVGAASVADTARARDWRSYARHRLLRVLPAAWLAVLASALLLPAGLGRAPYLRIATLTQVYSPQPSVPGLTQMWSLATEGAFYLVLPLAVLLLARLGSVRRILLALAATPLVAVVWTVLTHDRLSGTPNLWLPGYVGWFGAGMALAVWREARLAGVLPRTGVDELAAHPGTVWALAGATYLLLSTLVAGPLGLTPATAMEAVVKTTGYTVLGVLAVLPCVAPGREQPGGVVSVLGGRVAQLLGDVSYGVFCYHLVVLGLVQRALGHRPFSGDGPLLWVLTVAVTLPVAWASHRWLERPILRWARRRDLAVPAAPAAPGSSDSASTGDNGSAWSSAGRVG